MITPNNYSIFCYLFKISFFQVSLQQTVKAREQRADAKGGSAKKGGKPDKKKGEEQFKFSD